MAGQPLLVRLSIGRGHASPVAFSSPTAPFTVVDNRNGTFTITGGGVVINAGRKGASLASSITGGGDVLVNGSKKAAASVTLTGGGVVTVSGGQGGQVTLRLTGGGDIVVTETTNRTLVGSIKGGGDIILNFSENVSFDIAISGGGVVTIVTSGTLPAAQAIAIVVDAGGGGPVAKRRAGWTEFDDWTIPMDDDAIVELYVVRKSR